MGRSAFHVLSNPLLWGLDGTWIKPVVLSLRLRGAGLSSFIRSQSRSNCPIDGSLAALIHLGTTSDVTDVLELLAALTTSSGS